MSVPKTKQEVVLEAWDRLDNRSIGASEISLIQTALAESFGEGAADSPATLARILADAGAEFRHPQILEADAAWRLSQLKKFPETNFEDVKRAVGSLKRIEEVRARCLTEGDTSSIRRLTRHVRELRRDLLESGRELDTEAAEWLRIWLDTPELFADWLSLRLNSPDFGENFD